MPRGSRGFGRAVSRILSAPCGGENHLSMQPYPESVRFRGSWSGPPRGFPIWPCTRWGFPCRVACASRGALLPHLFTITAGLRRRLFYFLWHDPSTGLEAVRLRVSPAKPELRSIAPCGVRTFLPGLASGAILRPAKTSFRIIEVGEFLKQRNIPASEINLMPSFVNSLRLGNQLAQRKSQGVRNGVCRVQIGAAFVAFQHTNVCLMKSRQFSQSRTAQIPFLAVIFNHERKGI